MPSLPEPLRRPAVLCLAVLPFLSPAASPASSNPVDLLQEGLEAVLDERFEDAARAFQEILRYEPNNSSAQLGLKNAQRKVDERIAARRAEEKPALEAARKAMKREDWAEASDRLRGILSRQADHPEALSLQGGIRERMSKQMKKAKPQSSDWYYAQGVLAYIEEDWLKAVDSWDHVVAFDPNQVGLMGRIEQAKERLEGRDREKKLEFYNQVAFESLRKGDYAEAIRNWQELLKLDPSNGQAQMGMAEAQKAWDEDRKRDRQDEVQKLSEQAMDAYIERNHKKSRGLWNQVLELDPDNTLARDYIRRMGGGTEGGAMSAVGPDGPPSSGFEKALDFLKDDRYSEAAEYLERYTVKHPGDKRALEVLNETREKQKALTDKAYRDGLMTYSQGDVQGAIAVWQDALRVDPGYQRARQAIIKAMAELRKQQQGGS